MKKLMTLLALFAACLCATARPLTPQVNENVELMSILSRMAGYPEYHMDMAGQYIKDMDSYFKDNANHPAVRYMKEIRESHGIAFDAVMSMAIHLDNQDSMSFSKPIKTFTKRESRLTRTA